MTTRSNEPGALLRESPALCRFSLPAYFASGPKPGGSRCLAPPPVWPALHPASVRHNGTMLLDDVAYFVQQALVSHYVDLCVNAVQQELIVYYEQQPLKRIPLKGLHKTSLAFEECVTLIEQQARTSQRRLQHVRRRASTDAA